MGSCCATDRIPQLHDLARTNSPKVYPDDCVDVEHVIFNSYGDIKAKYQIGQSLGSGTYGETFEAICLETGMKYALKTIEKPKSHSQLMKVHNEIYTLKTLDHPNILKIHEIVEDSEHFYLLTELCEGGQIFDDAAEMERFSEKKASKIMKQILAALNHSHANNIVHRDVKSGNVLFEYNDDQDEEASIKLIDFGDSANFSRDTSLTGLNGTPLYLAPEVIKGSYNEKCDIWSAGIILYQMLSGKYPFKGKDFREVLAAIYKCRYDFEDPAWSGISSEAKDMITGMLNHDVAKRLSAEEAISHPWILKYNKPKANPLKSEKNAPLVRDLLHNMHQFSKTQKLKSLVLLHIGNRLSAGGDTADLDEIFIYLDQDCDGAFGKEDFKRVFGHLKNLEVDAIVDSLDVNKSGLIEYSEFLSAALMDKIAQNEKLLRVAFDSFAEENGKICLSGLRERLSHLSTETLEDYIQEGDFDGDGEITFEDFKLMMKSDTQTRKQSWGI